MTMRKESGENVRSFARSLTMLCLPNMPGGSLAQIGVGRRVFQPFERFLCVGGLRTVRKDLQIFFVFRASLPRTRHLLQTHRQLESRHRVILFIEEGFAVAIFRSNIILALEVEITHFNIFGGLVRIPRMEFVDIAVRVCSLSVREDLGAVRMGLVIPRRWAQIDRRVFAGTRAALITERCCVDTIRTRGCRIRPRHGWLGRLRRRRLGIGRLRIRRAGSARTGFVCVRRVRVLRPNTYRTGEQEYEKQTAHSHYSVVSNFNAHRARRETPQDIGERFPVPDSGYPLVRPGRTRLRRRSPPRGKSSSNRPSPLPTGFCSRRSDPETSLYNGWSGCVPGWPGSRRQGQHRLQGRFRR